MPKRKSISPPVETKVYLDVEIAAQIKLELYDEEAGRVPHGAQNRLINQILQEHYNCDKVPLEAYGLPQGFYVIVPKGMAQAVKDKLKG